MKAFDPKVIDKSIFAKAGITNVQLVSVSPELESLPRECLNNVRAYIENYGGEIQLGWIFSIIGNIALKLTAHAVVKKENGDLLCVTPNEYRKGKLKFSCDNSIESSIENDFLPSRLVSLINDKTLDSYLFVLDEVEGLRFEKINHIVRIQREASLNLKLQALYPTILSLAKRNTNKTDYCFCGSGKKNKKCCGKSL